MSQPRSRGLAVLGLGATALLALTACSSSDDGASDGAGDPGDDQVKIGVLQFVQHDALDAATEGFKEAVDVAGINAEYDDQNAQGEVANTNTIASTFASDGDLDLVLANATPSAQAAAQQIIDIPVLFTSVTDAVEAGLVDSNEAPGSNVTGTSDLNPVAEQLELLTEIAPDAKTVGVVYSSGEVNSEVQVELAKDAASELGLTIEEATVSNSAEVQQAAQSLDGVDAFYVPTDNTVVSGIAALIQVAEQNQIPVISGDSGPVEGGAIATLGIDYYKLGYQTGEMAASILQNGEDPAEMPVETSNDVELIINPAAAERMGVELPASVVDRADQVIE
ncbi:ABC transporter substrate-binding protein [Microbacterium sp. JB110]|uniref:ABC transporter substrate-binding protein n=1 Tax=Microbacterium sp. JB110 TaxID=2024477 RepID=UPI00097E77B1|nr:ABC transporter substrate-binding protein [Microbacterium sp. JB110]RCS57670.1 ABC transporter substrate-binding protein [Microbacterium sp. JB110]SJM45967.1 ABC transporter substrate-binding protein [Frigoribacterium sp. JB110]